MRIYGSVEEAVKEIERDLFEMGILAQAKTYQDKDISGDPDFDTKELVGYQYMLTRFDDLDKALQLFHLPKTYAVAELEERTRGQAVNPGRSWLFRADVWRPFLQEDRYFAYTYSERFSGQLQRVVERLQRDPDSRQVVLTVYDQHQDLTHWGGGGRVPCSMYYHFMSRAEQGERKLNLIYHMRSCDFYTHFGYDLWLALFLLCFVAGETSTERGSFIHCIDSLHAFRKDWAKQGAIF